MESAKHHVIVLGAGVIGLQTAITLLNAGIRVTIVSKFWPGDKDIEYTSPWAGAQWRSNIDRDDLAGKRWNQETFDYWKEEVKVHTPQESGLEMNTAVVYWDLPDVESEDPETQIWYSKTIPGFQKIEKGSLPPGIVAGITYQTYCLSPTLFLQHRMRQCLALGAKRVSADIECLQDVFRIESCLSASGVVVCAGLGACKLVPDDKVYPTKGQSIIVKGKAERITIRVGGKWDIYCIPQPGTDTTFLAGCKIQNDWTATIDHDITRWILDRCRLIAPELLDGAGEFQVHALQVGHRPSRRGGPRVEVEWLNVNDRGRKFVCHNYGHGGSGYEDSVGTANSAAQLVMKALGIFNET